MLVSALKKLTLNLNGCTRQGITTGSAQFYGLSSRICGNLPYVGIGTRYISTTPALCAEPLKKKKRIDPAIVRAREQRKQRKLEKQIRRLAKHARQLKPLDECQVPVALIENPKQRERKILPLSEQEVEDRWLLQKDVAKFKFMKVSQEVRFFEKLQSSQERALTELKMESKSLYEAAISIDESLLPFTVKGPVDTPPLKGYVCPEGDYIDISKKWDP